ncbi:MAG: lipid-A-disaccharide synthase [Turneriella sp.]|nr:lipid-A-disaccharide synthase [Turneriella sp.]
MKRSTRTKKPSSANTKSKKARKRGASTALRSRTKPAAALPRLSALEQSRSQPVLIVAGEESGDILGGAIVREVLKKRKLSLWGCGGRRMAEAGMEIFYPAEKLATIGFWEAAKNYRRLSKIVTQLVDKAVATNTKEAWLIDFPGFNILLAKKLKERGIRSTLIVSPTVWAWKYNRVFKIRERFERVLCLYDFEPGIYEKIGVEAHYIGHPLTAETAVFKSKIARTGNPLKKVPALREVFRKKQPLIAILPGSRPAEIHHHTARILAGVREFQKKHSGYAFVLPAANEKIHKLLAAYELPPDTYLTEFSARYVLSTATAAIACSGTVTLECALFGVPHLILYRSSWLSYAIFKGIIRIPYIGMVNVLAGKFIVPEYLQYALKPANIAAELEKILDDDAYRATQKAELKKIAARLTAYEPAKQAARILTEKLSF